MQQAISTILFKSIALLALFLATAASAQEARWVQIEARPNLAQAEERARAYADRLENVNGFRLPSGWYAIALGPFTPETAPVVLSQLRGAREIPGDSFVADGTGFQQQFWPVGAQFRAIEPIAALPPGQLDPGALRQLTPAPAPAPVTPAPVAAAPTGETLTEARAAERALTREDREDIQRALQWEGIYTARIDGAFGPGTRRAIEEWQLRNALPVTGVLMTVERNRLINDFRSEVASLGLTSLRDNDAGIEITLPAAMVMRDRVEAPFVQYVPRDGSEVSVLLISQSGDAATLGALYDVMQTLEVVPLTGPRELGGSSFTLVGEDADVISYTYAELRADAIKGFTLNWPRGDERRRQRVLNEMRASFTPLPGQVLPDDAVALDGATRQALLAGLEIRQPDASNSGFFVDGTGGVLTAAGNVGTCARITLGDDLEAEVLATDAALGLALLRPRARLAPIAYAEIDAREPRLGSEISVSGYSFAGLLGAPTVTFGELADTKSLDGRTELTRLALLAEEGDDGGPVFDARGSVVGLLLPPEEDAARRLPDEVRYATDAEAIATFLSLNGVQPRASDRAEALAPEDLATLAADMTVLVRCWN
jgi:S1-C subfamily serine protease